MNHPYYVTHIATSAFEREYTRRARLKHAREAAAAQGYKGPMSFHWGELHGRRRFLVEIRVHP